MVIASESFSICDTSSLRLCGWVRVCACKVFMQTHTHAMITCRCSSTSWRFWILLKNEKQQKSFSILQKGPTFIRVEAQIKWTTDDAFVSCHLRLSQILYFLFPIETCSTASNTLQFSPTTFFSSTAQWIRASEFNIGHTSSDKTQWKRLNIPFPFEWEKN